MKVTSGSYRLGKVWTIELVKYIILLVELVALLGPM